MAEITEQEKLGDEELILGQDERDPALWDAVRSIESMITEARATKGPLEDLVHSVKMRVKSEKSLRDKLYRKIDDSHKHGTAFDITIENFFKKITDLAAYPLIPLHPNQMIKINKPFLHSLANK